MIKFTKSSSFYSRPVWEFNLPAGYSCPFAKMCLTYADPTTGKQRPGRDRVFRCYAACGERFPAVRTVRWANYHGLLEASKLGGVGSMFQAIRRAFPDCDSYVRIHGSGDFFSQEYFDAWLMIATSFPNAMLWAFTKSVRFWVARLGLIPPNLTLQASYGGEDDALIEKHGLKFAKWFPNRAAAVASGLPIDTDDTLAMKGTRSFALIDNFSKE